MSIRALEKHQNYIKEFNGQEGKELFPKNTKAIIPYIL